MTPAGDAVRAAVVKEALSWLGTPYHHAANLKGVGVDCVFFAIEVYAARGIITHFDPRPYAQEWFLHRNEELYLMGVERYARAVKEPYPGDLELFKYGRTVSHSAIIVDDNLMIHAHRTHGNVELCERRAYADRHDSYWSPFP